MEQEWRKLLEGGKEGAGAKQMKNCLLCRWWWEDFNICSTCDETGSKYEEIDPLKDEKKKSLLGLDGDEKHILIPEGTHNLTFDLTEDNTVVEGETEYKTRLKEKKKLLLGEPNK